MGYDCEEEHEPVLKETYEHPAGVFDKGRVIILHNIEVFTCKCGETPIYPNSGPLIRLVAGNPSEEHFTWLADERTWKVGR